MSLHFDGQRINASGVDGPYRLKNLTITGAGETLAVLEEIPTSAYTYTQFEGVSTLLTLSPPPNRFGWNNADVTATLSVPDSSGGLPVKEIHYRLNAEEEVVVPASSATTSLNADGVFTLSYFSVDQNNVHEPVRSFRIGVDKTPPSVRVNLDPVPNEGGWHKTDVIVRFTAQDALSGVSQSPAPITLTQETSGRMVEGVVEDFAGHKTTTEVQIKIDKTNPDLTISIQPAPNAAGWNNANTTVHFLAEDALSGIAHVTSPVVLTEDGANQVVTGQARDHADNESAVSVTVHLDKTPPDIVTPIIPYPVLIGTSFPFSFRVTDSLSGMKEVSGTFNGSPIQGETPLRLDHEGENILIVLATDVADNRVEERPTIFVCNAEGFINTDGDELVNCVDPDDDNDGVLDVHDECPLLSTPNVIEGTDGSDDIKGTSGNDLIRGFGGKDKIRGKGGHDCLVGGDGDDDIKGGQGNDILLGGEGDDKLRGESGNDTLEGGDGDDDIKGEKGDDILLGGNGHDKLRGGPGNDTLDGGRNKDDMGGESGDDTFHLDAMDTPAGTMEKIRGHEGQDRLELGTDIGLSDLTAGNITRPRTITDPITGGTYDIKTVEAVIDLP